MNKYKIEQLNNGLEQIGYMIDREENLYLGKEQPTLKYIHPQITMPIKTEECDWEWRFLNQLKTFVWYYTVTSNNNIKNKIRKLVYYTYDAHKKLVENKFPDSSYKYVEKIDLDEFIEIYIDLYKSLKQDFIQCRYGGEILPGKDEGAIYFRIDDSEFDWFPIIWDFVYSNKNYINNVTIEYMNECLPYTIWKYKNKEINHIPIDEFILL